MISKPVRIKDIHNHPMDSPGVLYVFAHRNPAREVLHTYVLVLLMSLLLVRYAMRLLHSGTGTMRGGENDLDGHNDINDTTTSNGERHQRS
jgi:hypothetical protein